MNESFDRWASRPRPGHRRRWNRRLLALFLSLAILGSVLPVAAARGLNSTPRLSSVSLRPEDASTASAGSTAGNNYILEVSTGSVRGGACAENVQYFVIYYTAGGTQRSAVIFPGEDGVSYGFEKANQVGNRDLRRQDVTETFGYTTKPLSDRKGLGSVQTDQFLFTSPYPITSIDRIQVFGKMTYVYDPDSGTDQTMSTWACQGMRIYRVDTLYGLDMYGWYSSLGYIDFDGEIIADVVMATGGGIFHWQNSGGAFNITGPMASGGAAGVTLVNTETAEGYSQPNFVGTHHSSQVSNRVVFRLDLADMGGAGFECLAGSYEAGSHTTISALKLCETACLQIRYVDIYECVRDVDLPLIINALGWTKEQVGDVAIAAYAQQGESIAVSAMLPDFSELNSVVVTVGESRAAAAAHLLTDPSANQTIRGARLTKSGTDDISYLCFAAYRDVTVNIRTDSATIQYEFVPGAQEPTQYYTAGGIEGVSIEAGTDSNLTLLRYHEGLTLHPVDRLERYLITIRTDNVANAGTTSDVYLQFSYISMKDKELTTEVFSLKEYIQQFYGEWAGNKENFAYNYGLRMGGLVRFILPIQGVKQFKTLSVRVEGEDEWQFRGIQIQKVNSYGSRIIQWQEIDDQGLRSHLIYDREVSAQNPCFRVGDIYADEEPPEPTDDGWVPGSLVQDDSMFHEFNGQSQEISAQEDVDWDTLQYYMTYEDTLQDLGLNRERCVYEVEVNVAGDKVNKDDDDCGSANLFYFQLVFEFGNSGCVLANQQLSGDSFRTGAKATFRIPTTRDYGELTAIRIIPDNQDSNGNIYDKLKIDYITVRRQSTGKISPTWTADSDSADGLGWVGIDYRDPGAMGTTQGAQGRSVTEISHTYQITKSSYSTKLLISITTGSYASTPKQNAQGETVIIDDPILQGGMTMSFNYYNHDGQVKHVDPVDIVHLMNEYSGRNDSFTRTIDDVTETVDYSVSNPEYQFRPSTVDSFYIDVDNISQLIDMQLQIRSSVVTKWNIQSVSVYLVQGPGTRYINSNGEYDYKYPEGQELSFRATWNRTQSLVKDVQIYRTLQKNSIGEVNITFLANEFPNAEEEQWASAVAREPNSRDDVVNLFLYPSMENAAADPTTYGLSGEILFTDTLRHSANRINTGLMQRTTDSSGRTVFYALGVNTQYLDAISGVEVSTNSVRPIYVPISYGIVQVIRSGVLIDSYYLYGAGNADSGLTLRIGSDPSGQEIQHVLLQVDQSQSVQDLIPEEKDLAVALYFTTDDPYGGELRTKYIYLTDQGYTGIEPGDVLDVTFNIDNLKEVVGLNLVTLGRLNVTFDNGLVLNQTAAGAVTGKWSFQGSMAPTRSPIRYATTGSVALLDLDLTTAADDGSVTSGTTGPIRMTVGYYNRLGAEINRTYNNIRFFADSQTAFRSGSTDHVRLLIPDVEELRWIEFEPLANPSIVPAEGTTQARASWRLDRMAVTKDLSGVATTRILDTLIVTGEPLRISLAEMLMAGTVSIVLNANDTGVPSGDYVIPTNGNLDLALNAGEGVRIVPRLEGSGQGVVVVLNRYDPVTGGLGRPELQDTRGYTAAVLQANAASSGPEEAAVWNSVVIDDGIWQVKETLNSTGASDTEYVLFLPPRNYTGAVIYFRVTITSRENPNVFVTLNVTVPTEENPIPALASAARARDMANTGHEHNLTFVAATAPTCTEPGQSACYYCAGCGRYFTDALGENVVPLFQLAIPATGHTEGEIVYENEDVNPPTCAAQGSKDAVMYCAVCGVEISRVTVAVPATGQHTYLEWYHNGDGTETATCVVCGHVETRVVPDDQQPTDPTEPTDPTDPTEPTEPTDPTEPPEPADPTEPPEDPTDPTEPTEPTDPTDPEDPTDPTDPSPGGKT